MTYSVYQGDLEKDKKAILSFWNRNHTIPLDDKYRWIYEGNPAGKTYVWLLRHEESDSLVGMSSLFTRTFSIGGKNCVAGIAGDFFVDPNHRTLGPALMLQQSVKSAADNEALDFIYGFPNETAATIFKRVGYRLVGPTKRFVKIIKTDSQLINRGVPEFLSRLLGPLLNLILQMISIETWYRFGKDLVCEEIDRLDERFDHLWQKREL